MSPFRSDAQRKFLYAKKPSIAKKFAAESPKGANLPEHVKKHQKTMATMKKRMAK